MNINDILFTGAEEESDNMDILMDYDSAELMSSEFFDSVLSLENDLEEKFLTNFEDDNNLSSSDTSHSDGGLSPQSFCSESDKNSTCSTDNTDIDSNVVNIIDSLDDPEFLSFFDTIKTQQIEKAPPQVAKPILGPTRATKILIQNPSNKKCITKPMSNATQLRKPLKGKPQILKVQQLGNNGRPVLVPLGLKSIKILNTSAEVAALTNKKCKITESNASEDGDRRPVGIHQYPPLNLNNEEKRLLAKEGIQLPSHYPLTKNEERELKRIRRKIRNKISAQDSRKRKKEYVDGLEERVKRGSEENKNLLQRVRELQKQNRTLIAHVNRLQALICKSSTSKATPSTCLMVVLLSALLVSLPNMRLFENKQAANDGEQVSIRRSLLSDLQATEDDLNMEEFLIFKDDEPDLDTKFDAIDNVTSTILENSGKKYEDFMVDKNDSKKIDLLSKVMEAMKNLITEKKVEFFDIKGPSLRGTFNKNGFIEPDIDDYHPGDEGPPLKRAKYIKEYESTSTKIGSETILSPAIRQVTKEK
ncbi:hypothetical protein ABEB36_011422 [Hypothenemus hampei]|uniref:BZIP domain-containing protein n=1 Tax=Hypothenemus hampei TaxID=57062 RepID=A0ABD1EFD3_HYPHA